MKSSFPQRRPIIFTVLLLLVILVTFFLAGAVTYRLKLPTLAITIMGEGVLALALLVGFVEETYFRGMMLRALLSRGPWQAVIISSFLFGIAHPFNLLAGANLAATLLQVVYAFALGMMYAALVLRTQTILPLIVTHGLTNFFAYLAVSTVETTSLSTLSYVVTAGEILIYIAYSSILMRQVKQQTFGAEMGTLSMPPLAHE